MSYRRDRSESREDQNYRGREDEFEGGRRVGGQSRFAERGLSHEERMRDDDSAARFPGRDPAQGRTGYGQGRGYEGASHGGAAQYPRGEAAGRGDPQNRGGRGYYGSGGSYGYGGGYEHGGQSGPNNEYRGGGDPGRGNQEFHEATGGFGYDTSGYGRQGLGHPGHDENRAGHYGGGVHQGGGRGYFNEDADRTASGRGYFNEDARQGFTQTAGYWQSGGDRVGAQQSESTREGSGYGRADFHSDGRGHHGGGRSPGNQGFGAPRARGPYYGRLPQGYTRSDERIREDVCERLSHGHIDPSQISVRVEGGVVTLEGGVQSRQDKYIAEEILEEVLGVREVDNRLRVRRADDRGALASEGSPGESQGQGVKPRNGTTGGNGNVNGPRS